MNTALFDIIWRDGVLYFFAIFSMNLVNIGFLTSAPQGLRAVNLTYASPCPSLQQSIDNFLKPNTGIRSGTLLPTPSQPSRRGWEPVRPRIRVGIKRHTV